MVAGGLRAEKHVDPMARKRRRITACRMHGAMLAGRNRKSTKHQMSDAVMLCRWTIIGCVVRKSSRRLRGFAGWRRKDAPAFR
jgi:hypothetical protein